jgi:LDH2 family malate/lactate/ureidoglycolate dehydrogenase
MALSNWTEYRFASTLITDRNSISALGLGTLIAIGRASRCRSDLLYPADPVLHDRAAAYDARANSRRGKGVTVTIETIAGPRVSADDLRRFVAELLISAGADAASSAATAKAVIDASSRAFDTHGIRLVPFYLQTLEGGRINPAPRIKIERKATSVLHVDADNGFGHAASFAAIDEACAVAAETGVAVATVGRSSHHGATGCYTRGAALKGFAAIGMTHADSVVVPYGGKQAFFGTNPLSFALPIRGEDPLLLDMATSAIPFNRVMLRRVTGTPLPPEVALRSDAAFTTDPNDTVALAPLGGGQFGYKGAGLAAMIDLLCSAFTGMGHGHTLKPFGGPDFATPIPIGHFFIVLAPAFFQALAAFDGRVTAFLDELRAQPAKPGQTVQAPGDLEKAEAARRKEAGIPVDTTTWSLLCDAAARLGVPLPQAHSDRSTERH